MILILAKKLNSYYLAEKKFQAISVIEFNDNLVQQVQLQKQLGLFLDPQLSSDEYIQRILNKTRKIIGLIGKLHTVIPRAVF